MGKASRRKAGQRQAELDRPLRVVMIQQNPGSRTARIIKALATLGHEVHLVTRWPLRQHEDVLESLTYWCNVQHLMEILQDVRYRDADVWHVGQYNDTEWLTRVCIHARAVERNHMPRIIHDARDVRSMMPLMNPHNGKLVPIEGVQFEELNAFRLSDGIIHVSDMCRSNSEKIHYAFPGVDTGKLKPPTCITRNMPARDEVPETVNGPDNRKGVVYSGGLGQAGSQQIRDYGAIFEAMVDPLRSIGQDMWIQSAAPSDVPETEDLHDQYRMRGVKVHNRVPDDDLIQHLQGWRWGFVGFQQPFPLGVAALPNKLFEYIAAGVVPVCFNCVAGARLVQKLDIGLEFYHPSDLPSLLTEQRYQRHFAKLQEVRRDMCMENEVESSLLPLYRKVCSLRVRHRSNEVTSFGLPVLDPFEQPTPPKLITAAR